MKIALLVEGRSSEEKTIKIITRKIIRKETGVVTRVIKRGNLLDDEKVYSHIVNDLLIQHPDISKIIACVDSECTAKEEMEKEVRKIEETIKAKINLPISYVVVVHALEGWLLADPDCIKEYLGPRAEEISISHSATLECKPKETMKDIFRKAEKDFIPLRDDPRIAEKFNFDVAAKHNESFAIFLNKIKDP